jgi:hypothetical protein
MQLGCLSAARRARKAAHLDGFIGRSRSNVFAIRAVAAKVSQQQHNVHSDQLA